MRRVTLMVAAMALMVSLFAAVAYAATIEGTNQEGEILQESNLNDTIFGRGGSDVINARTFANDTDLAKGNAGNDQIHVDDGDTRDTANGGNGVDTCFGDRLAELNCEDEIVETGPGGF
jgi:Ca2+-binding RTX toxin-like protein